MVCCFTVSAYLVYPTTICTYYRFVNFSSHLQTTAVPGVIRSYNMENNSETYINFMASRQRTLHTFSTKIVVNQNLHLFFLLLSVL